MVDKKVHTPRIFEAAEKYCSLGIRTFITRPGAKWGYEGWQNDATSDYQELKKAIENDPGCGLAFVTGEPNGFDVWDIDGETGLEALETWLAQGNEFPRTHVSRTGSGGLHVFFKHKPGMRNKGRFHSTWDIRATGGLVVAAPTIHPEALQPYRWWDYEENLPVELDSVNFTEELAEWPEALLELIEKSERKKNDDFRDGKPIPLGVQETTLTSIAGMMRARGLSAEEMYGALVEIARHRCDPPMHERDARRIAESVAKYHPDDPLISIELTDRGWGRRFAHYAENSAAWVTQKQSWAIWDMKRWQYDVKGSAVNAGLVIDRFVDVLISRADQMPDNSQQEKEMRLATLEYAKMGRFVRTMDIIEKQARRYAQKRVKDFDADPWLFSVDNGSVDLRTGELREHRPEDLGTRISPVSYSAEAECPQWLEFIDTITEGDQELATYIQRVVGYTMSGMNDEQILAIVYGRGGTGKSTFLTILSHVFGEYAAAASPGIFLLGANDGGPQSGIAKLPGVRLVSGVEINEDRRLDEALVKNLTGNEEISTRDLHEKEFSFKPQFTIWLTTNEMPMVSASDAIFRRIKAIPIDKAIPEEKRNKNLVHEIISDEREMSGILNWCIQGCLDWQNHGLGESQKVIDATAQYKEEMNPAAKWIEEVCTVDFDSFVDATFAWTNYEGWFRFNGFGRTSRNEFYKHLRRLGYEPGKVRRAGAKTIRVIEGLDIPVEAESKFTRMARE